MLLWGPKDCGVSSAHFPLPFSILSFEGSQRLILPSGAMFSVIMHTFPHFFSLFTAVWTDIQWHGCWKYMHMYTYMHAHTHIYSFLKQNLWVERKVFCKWHLHIIFFLNVRSLISEKEIRGLAHGWGVPTNMRSTRELTLILHSHAWKGSKGEAGDSQVFVDKSEHAHCLPVGPYRSQPHL